MFLDFNRSTQLNTPTKTIREELDVQVKKRVNVYNKENSKLMSFIGFFVGLFNPRFKDYSNMFFGNLYISEKHRNSNLGYVSVLMHELTHLSDRNTYFGFRYKFFNRLLFDLAYVFPQCFGILGFLGFLGFIYTPLFSLFVFLLCFLPIGAKYRELFEIRGYATSLFVERLLLNKSGSSLDLNRYMTTFTGPAYYYMTPQEDWTRVENEIKGLVVNMESSLSLAIEVNPFILELTKLKLEHSNERQYLPTTRKL